MVDLQKKTSVDPNTAHCIIELSDISLASPRPEPNNGNVIVIDETDVEIVENATSEAQIIVPIVPSDNVISSIAVDTIDSSKKMGNIDTNREGKFQLIDSIDIDISDSKPKGRRGRPKKVKFVDDDKIHVSTKALFKKRRQSQRGTKRKHNNHD